MRWLVILVASSGLVIGAGLLAHKSTNRAAIQVPQSQHAGRYCLIKPGQGHSDCEGVDTTPDDPFLSAMKQMDTQGLSSKMNIDPE